MKAKRTHLVFKGHASGGHDLFTLGAFGSKFFFEAAHAIHIRLVGNDERLGTHLRLADHALEAFIMPLLGLVLHFFHA